MIKLRTLLLCDYLYIFLVLVALFYSYIIANCVSYQSKYDVKDTSVEGYIHDLFIDGNKLKIELIGKERIIVNYYFETLKEKDSNSLKLGDYIKVSGNMTKPKSATIFNLFDYQKYLYNNKIFFLFTAERIDFVKHNTRVRYKIKQFMIDHIDRMNLSSDYINALVIGNNNGFDRKVAKSFQYNGVSHLFAISGTHIAFIAVALLWFLKKLKLEENKRYYLVILFLFFYMFLTDYSGSVMRATIFFILLSINKMYYFHIKTINVLALTLFILLIYKPGLLYDIGFQFSFIISFYLVLFQDAISKTNNYIKKTLLVSLIAFLASIPIVINNFYQINLLSPLLNVFFVPYVTLVLFPISFLCLVFPLIDSVLSFFINILEYVTLFFSNIKIGEVILAKPPFIIIITYYFLITISIKGMAIKKYHYLLPLCILITIHYNANFFNKDPYIVFLDVGQGDSIFINLPHNKGNILVDTGGKLNYTDKWERRNNEYKIGEDSIIPYLKSIGINSLDYLFLTHGDADHMGESEDIIKNFNISKVIFNSGSLTKLELSLIGTLNDKNISYFSGKRGNVFNINGYHFHLLNPKIDYDENNNSLVLYTVLNNKRILLTGDISIEIEKDIINEYPRLKADILKIGHHGSITSTCEEFLDALEPNYSVIQVGLNNRFNHPHKEVINRLNKRRIKTYQTSIDGSIKFIIRANEVTIVSAFT